MNESIKSTVTQKLDYKLCYVDENFAYFTSRDLKDQWGDDWNDAPFEHNAGKPYTHTDEKDEPSSIIKVAFDGYFDTPNVGALNSRWSVEAINAGAIAWLHHREKNIYIPAGITLRDFMEKIQSAEGSVYFSRDLLEIIYMQESEQKLKESN